MSIRNQWTQKPQYNVDPIVEISFISEHLNLNGTVLEPFISPTSIVIIKELITFYNDSSHKDIEFNINNSKLFSSKLDNNVMLIVNEEQRIIFLSKVSILFPYFQLIQRYSSDSPISGKILSSIEQEIEILSIRNFYRGYAKFSINILGKPAIFTFNRSSVSIFTKREITFPIQSIKFEEQSKRILVIRLPDRTLSIDCGSNEHLLLIKRTFNFFNEKAKIPPKMIPSITFLNPGIFEYDSTGLPVIFQSRPGSISYISKFIESIDFKHENQLNYKIYFVPGNVEGLLILKDEGFEIKKGIVDYGLYNYTTDIFVHSHDPTLIKINNYIFRTENTEIRDQLFNSFMFKINLKHKPIKFSHYNSIPSIDYLFIDNSEFNILKEGIMDYDGIFQSVLDVLPIPSTEFTIQLFDSFNKHVVEGSIILDNGFYEIKVSEISLKRRFSIFSLCVQLKDKIRFYIDEKYFITIGFKDFQTMEGFIKQFELIKNRTVKQETLIKYHCNVIYKLEQIPSTIIIGQGYFKFLDLDDEELTIPFSKEIKCIHEVDSIRIFLNKNFFILLESPDSKGILLTLEQSIEKFNDHVERLLGTLNNKFTGKFYLNGHNYGTSSILISKSSIQVKTKSYSTVGALLSTRNSKTCDIVLMDSNVITLSFESSIQLNALKNTINFLHGGISNVYMVAPYDSGEEEIELMISPKKLQLGDLKININLVEFSIHPKHSILGLLTLDGKSSVISFRDETSRNDFSDKFRIFSKYTEKEENYNEKIYLCKEGKLIIGKEGLWIVTDLNKKLISIDQDLIIKKINNWKIKIISCGIEYKFYIFQIDKFLDNISKIPLKLNVNSYQINILNKRLKKITNGTIMIQDLVILSTIEETISTSPSDIRLFHHPERNDIIRLAFHEKEFILEFSSPKEKDLFFHDFVQILNKLETYSVEFYRDSESIGTGEIRIHENKLLVTLEDEEKEEIPIGPSTKILESPSIPGMIKLMFSEGIEERELIFKIKGSIEIFMQSVTSIIQSNEDEEIGIDLTSTSTLSDSEEESTYTSDSEEESTLEGIPILITESNGLNGKQGRIFIKNKIIYIKQEDEDEDEDEITIQIDNKTRLYVNPQKIGFLRINNSENSYFLQFAKPQDMEKIRMEVKIIKTKNDPTSNLLLIHRNTISVDGGIQTIDKTQVHIEDFNENKIKIIYEDKVFEVEFPTIEEKNRTIQLLNEPEFLVEISKIVPIDGYKPKNELIVPGEYIVHVCHEGVFIGDIISHEITANTQVFSSKRKSNILRIDFEESMKYYMNFEKEINKNDFISLVLHIKEKLK